MADPIKAFVKRLERNGVELHGFMLMHKGEVVAQGFAEPFHAMAPHRMYSVGKSLVSLMIGILEGEGKLKLSDPVADHFPDKNRDVVGDMTIADMLKMATVHRMTTYKCVQSDDWVDTFFTMPKSNSSGTVFSYDTSGSHTLSALIEKRTGMRLIDYFMQKLYTPLGMTGDVRWLPDPMGICQGGSGLVLSIADLMKLAACVMRGGDGIIPKDYIARATAKQIETFMQPNREERFGYGYQFWRTRENGYAMYGMGGQYAIMLPEREMILCTIADTQMQNLGTQDIFDAFFDLIANETHFEKAEYKLALPNVVHKNEFEAYPRTAYEFQNSALETLELKKDVLLCTLEGKDYVFPFTLGKVMQGTFSQTGEASLTMAGFFARNAFHLKFRLIGDSLCGFDMQCVFNDAEMTVQMRGVRECRLSGFDCVVTGNAHM